MTKIKLFLALGMILFVTIAPAMFYAAPVSAAETNVSEPTASDETDCTDGTLNRDNCGIVRYLVIFINILSAMVGIVVTAVIIIGGIQYSTSGGDPSKVSAAKKRIYNGVISLLAFIFSYAFLQWIVPGGVL